MPMPWVQCFTACSMVSHWGRGCLEVTQDVDIVPAGDAVVEARQSRQLASGGRYIRTTSAFLLATWSRKPGSWWVKPLWSCCQTLEEQDIVQGGDVLRARAARCTVFSHLAVLGEHGVHNADEGLVAVEEAVAAGEEVALQPALAHGARRAWSPSTRPCGHRSSSLSPSALVRRSTPRVVAS